MQARYTGPVESRQSATDSYRHNEKEGLHWVEFCRSRQAEIGRILPVAKDGNRPKADIRRWMLLANSRD